MHKNRAILAVFCSFLGKISDVGTFSALEHTEKMFCTYIFDFYAITCVISFLMMAYL